MKVRLCILFCFALLQFKAMAQVPLLNSLPGASYVVFLDFDGHIVNGTNWNSGYNNGNAINCIAAGFNSTQVTQAFNIVSEDYRPFNINVTTDSTVFAAAPAQQKVRVVITKTSSWYPTTVGGVAYLSSFTSSASNVCFVFNNNLSNNPSYVAEACSHEAGHTLSLSHHSDYNSSCVKQSDYLQGYGSGETSWAPIMGVGYYRNMTTWSNIAADFGCDYAQDDLAKITALYNRGVAYRSDDHGNDNASATELVLSGSSFSDSGLISTNTDADVFKLMVVDTGYVTIDATPWYYGSTNTKANLDILLLLKNNAGDTIHLRNPSGTLNASISNVLLLPGDYFIYIDGTSNNNQSGYGSIGKYFISGNINYAVTSTLASGLIASDTSICKGTAIHFSTQCTGNVTGYNWSFPGGTPSSATTKDPGAIAYNTAGTYSVTLAVSDGSGNSSKTITNYIKVNNPPTLSANPNMPTACGNTPVEILASGANYYKWSPATGLNNSTLARVKATVSAETIYTVTGTDNNGCTASKSVTVKHSVAPVLVRDPQDMKLYACEGDSVTLNISGADTYAWSPVEFLSDSTGASVKAATPIGNTFFMVVGTDSNGCRSSTSFNVTTRNCDTVAADFMVDKSAVCSGGCINFKDFSTGYPEQWNWSFPGGTPSASTEKNPGLVCYSMPGSYPVSLEISSGGVTSSKTTHNFVTVGTTPELTIVSSSGMLFCIGDSAILTVTGAQGYNWEPGTTLTYINSSNVKVRPIVNTTYYVTGTNFGNGPIGGGTNGEFTRCQQRDSFRMMVVNCVLPVKLLYYTAAMSGVKVNSQWAFELQDEINYFQVERSDNAVDFTGLERVNKNNRGVYSYSDRQWPASAKQLYYRLKWINFDGRPFYSPVVKIDVAAANNAASVWPNPVTNILHVQLNSTVRNKCSITLKNAVGVSVQQVSSDLHIGNNQFDINMSALPAGIYFLEARNSNLNKVIRIVRN